MRKILIIDDEEDILKVLEKRLGDAGYGVVKATSGKEGIEKAKEELPGLILLDILMPDMDGGEVAQALRDDPATKDIPVIFLSCLYTKNEEKQEGHKLGKNFFVAKPFEFNELLGIIDQNIK